MAGVRPLDEIVFRGGFVVSTELGQRHRAPVPRLGVRRVQRERGGGVREGVGVIVQLQSCSRAVGVVRGGRGIERDGLGVRNLRRLEVAGFEQRVAAILRGFGALRRVRGGGGAVDVGGDSLGTLGTLGRDGWLHRSGFGSLRGRRVAVVFVFAGVLLDDRDALPERLVRDGVAGAVLGAVVVGAILGRRRDRRRGRVADAVDDVVVGIVAVLLNGDGLPSVCMGS